MSIMKECLINSVRVSLINQERIVVLKEKDVERYLPIWIGLYEFEAITIALQKIEVARPLTHDLIRNIINTLDGRLVCVEINKLESDTYFAELVLENAGIQKRIDCRPSDAIALAVRSGVSILVSGDILDKAAVQPEESISIDSEEGEESKAEGSDLSVFEDFLGKLGKDSSDSDSDTSRDNLQDNET